MKGKDNPVADFLSRHFEKKEEVQEDVLNNVNTVNKCKYKRKEVNKTLKNNGNIFVSNIKDFPLTFSDFKNHQNEDEEVNKIIQSVNNHSNSEKFSLNKGVLMHQTSENSAKKIYLPKKLFDMVFKYFHNALSGCHLGMYKTIKKITEYFYMPNISEEVKSRIKSCELCSKGKQAQRYFKVL